MCSSTLPTSFRTDVRIMVNPALTILVDLILIGSALAIAASMMVEAWGERRPHVGVAGTSRPTVACRKRASARTSRTRYAVGRGRAA
jgi:hypothetical protein